MSPRPSRFLWAAIIIAGVAAFVHACGPEITFRAYLSKNFWRPTIRYIADLAKGLPAERKTYFHTPACHVQRALPHCRRCVMLTHPYFMTTSSKSWNGRS